VKKKPVKKTKETVKKETKQTVKETKKATTPKTKVSTKVKTKEKEVKPSPKPEVKAEPKEFVSMCGAKFNASPDSTCFLMCQVENKDDFQACLSNYETNVQIKQKPKLKRRKKIDYFGDSLGTSASMINALLVCGATMEEIQEELEIKKSRITGHFGGLRTRSIKTRPKQFEIFKCKETKRYFFDEDLPFYGYCDDCGNTSAK
jgi:hypothetical protein